VEFEPDQRKAFLNGACWKDASCEQKSILAWAPRPRAAFAAKNLSAEGLVSVLFVLSGVGIAVLVSRLVVLPSSIVGEINITPLD
jgi:hypothetical protein